MNSDLIPVLIIFSLIIGPIVVQLILARYRRAFLVNEGFTGLLYHEGKFVATLAPGRYIRWGRNFRFTWADTRKTLLQVQGQEVLTSDNVAVKISVVLTTQVIDVAKSAHEFDNQSTHLYSATQSALRSVVSGFTLEVLLAQRSAISTPLRDLIAPKAQDIGATVHSVEIRDIMLPGDLRKAFSETLKARQEGQAALERARGESAALRNLANAARLLEGQPALATLRFLQTLEASAGRQTLVMNDLAALLPALKSRGANSASTETPDS